MNSFSQTSRECLLERNLPPIKTESQKLRPILRLKTTRNIKNRKIVLPPKSSTLNNKIKYDKKNLFSILGYRLFSPPGTIPIRIRDIMLDGGVEYSRGFASPPPHASTQPSSLAALPLLNALIVKTISLLLLLGVFGRIRMLRLLVISSG